jgi:hypothetical protein
MRYSKKTKCFYPENIEYKQLPNDLITCSDECFKSAMSLNPGETFEINNGVLIITPPSKEYIDSQNKMAEDALVNVTSFLQDIKFALGGIIVVNNLISKYPLFMDAALNKNFDDLTLLIKDAHANKIISDSQLVAINDIAINNHIPINL